VRDARIADYHVTLGRGVCAAGIIALLHGILQ
jgi:hypothetical protein